MDESNDWNVYELSKYFTSRTPRISPLLHAGTIDLTNVRQPRRKVFIVIGSTMTIESIH